MNQTNKDKLNEQAFAVSFSLLVVALASSTILFILVMIPITWHFYKKIENNSNIEE